MAFPTVKFAWRDYAEEHEPVVLRSEMERGVPKQRRVASDARVQLSLTLHFDTKAEFNAFETWFYGEANAGQAWFDFTHPRTLATVQARVVGGKLGPVKVLQGTFEFATLGLQIEYWRAAW